MLIWWQVIIIVLVAMIIAAIATFFVTKHLFQKELKKNPPVTEAMIRAMMTQMGRTPSEKQVRAVMRSKQEAKK